MYDLPLTQKHFTPLMQAAKALTKPGDKAYRCFLEAIANYANNINSGFDTLYIKRENVCAIHLLRMIMEATTRTYGILLVDNPESYLKSFFKGNTTADKCYSKGDSKKILTTSVIFEASEEEYPRIKEIYDEANRYIHPTSFYCLGFELDEPYKSLVQKSQNESWVNHFARLRDKKEREWVYNIMDIANGILIEVIWKVADMVAPKNNAPLKMDLTSKK